MAVLISRNSRWGMDIKVEWWIPTKLWNSSKVTNTILYNTSRFSNNKWNKENTQPLLERWKNHIQPDNSFRWRMHDNNQQSTTNSCQMEGTFKEKESYNCREELNTCQSYISIFFQQTEENTDDVWRKSLTSQWHFEAYITSQRIKDKLRRRI